MEYYAILTDAGLAAVANAPVTGVPLTFTKFAAGDGGGEEYAPQAGQAAPRRPVRATPGPNGARAQPGPYGCAAPSGCCAGPPLRKAPSKKR